jgi:pyruvate/2-oxoglutarate dehydrogenase complex dihydrolipoamide dehydrogenase (E3) component/uncharacterized membrane protein YdjX (TVP38/TMEM64 family)
LARRPALLFLAVAAALVAYHLSGVSIDSPDSLRSALADLVGAQAAHPAGFAAIFFLAYVLVAALSLPLAVWMTLAAGALFGFWGGLAIVSFASAMGATLAFLTARHLLKDWVLARFGSRLATIGTGLDRDGALYLFTLRLIPAVPFVVVNLLMGLTSLSARTFYWVSQIGMLPATVLFVNAGTQLGGLRSLPDVLSLKLILSLALLGIFPWVARRIVRWVEARRLLARWTRPRRFDRNLIVIGGGAAGLVSSYIAATCRAKVTLIEGGKMGGDCLNHGCVPSKTLIRTARLAHQMRHADRWGLPTARPAVSAASVLARVREAIAAIEPHDSAERYRGLGVDVVAGQARLIDPWTVAIRTEGGGERRLTGRAIILATGTTPIVPDLPGLEEAGHLTTDTLWDALSARDSLPGRLVILGGGTVGCELAQAFGRLGVAVTLIESGPRLLSREDADVSAFAERLLTGEGVQVLTGHTARNIGNAEGAKWIEVEGGGESHRIAFEDLLVAVGRRARLSDMGLEELGITGDRTITANEWLETPCPDIFVAGDAAGPWQFTHVAAHQAWFATINALFGSLRRFRPDYRALPCVTFTDPEIARVGLTESEAKAGNIAHEVTRLDLGDLDRALTDGATEGFVKVLTTPGRDHILGAAIVGEHAGDLLAEFVLAMRHGIGLKKILGTVHSYPTFAEANRRAAGEWRKAHINPLALRLLARFHDWRRG